MLIKKLTAWLLSAGVMLIGNTYADDTELYVFESSARAGARPQVLIIFDNSGSMKERETGAEAGYDPTIEYPAVGGTNAFQKRMIYFTKGGVDNTSMPVPDSSSEARRFLNDINGCETAKHYLKTYGFFTGFFREYRFKGQNGAWQEVPDNSGADIQTIDCFNDIVNKYWQNAPGQPTGFPVDGLGDKKNPRPYNLIDNSSTQNEIDAAVEAAKQTGFGTGQSLTLYTDNYLRWYHGPKESVEQTRLQIAKQVISNTVITTPTVDFGLAIFNYNFPEENIADGGRIISGIQQMTESNKKSLLSTIDNLHSNTNTPLCETLYEVKRYFSGESVLFGYDDNEASGSNYKPNRPPRDKSIELSGNYISPFKACQNQVFVVYITDGAPTLDRNADKLIKNLKGVDTTPFKWQVQKQNRDDDEDDKPKYHSNFLPNLAEWMFKHDVNSNLPDKQTVKTFTIGFSAGAKDAAPVLSAAAKRGGGQYFAASDAAQLQSALQQVFSQILEVNASFTSPSIASNNFDRTQTFDAVYYAMFLPNKGPRWMGNLKKFKVTGSGDIRDKKNKEAIGIDGNLSSSACSYWTADAVCASASDGGDGNDVTIGGAAEMLRQTSSRKVLSDFAGNGADLAVFSVANAIARAGNETLLAEHMRVDKTQLAELFDWAKGIDVDDDDADGSTTDQRWDIIGDPLHSKPLAVNLGTVQAPDIRVLMGTNHGQLHMFKDAGNTVSESWAFLPYELLPNLTELKANVPTGVHSVYGIDSSPIAYVETTAQQVKKAWVFVGMRRGGSSYYALDITQPDHPKFMWRIGADSLGMAEMGQSWAEPVITRIPGWPVGNTDAASAKPVLIFGAGYVPATKDGAEVGAVDSKGRGVFIVDAETGVLVHKFDPDGGTKATQLPQISDSIPNAVAILDSNNDRLTDRIYATDTGGNVWRIDLPGADPDSRDIPWTAYKFAALGGDTQQTDRRFFAEPVVAQTMFSNISITEHSDGSTTKAYQNIPYDAVAIASGHRPHPTDKLRQDKLYLLQDRNVVTRSYSSADRPTPLTQGTLYDITANSPDSETDNITFGQQRGWYYQLGAKGEKSLASAAIIQGRVYFTSYVPGDTSAANSCLVAGQGRMYAFDLHRGTRSYTQEYLELGERVPDTPQLVVPPNGTDPSYMYLIGIGNAANHMTPVTPPSGCPPGDTKCVGGGLRANRIFYHIAE